MQQKKIYKKHQKNILYVTKQGWARTKAIIFKNEQSPNMLKMAKNVQIGGHLGFHILIILQ